jgi:hypothetical protein
VYCPRVYKHGGTVKLTPISHCSVGEKGGHTMIDPFTSQAPTCSIYTLGTPSLSLSTSPTRLTSLSFCQLLNTASSSRSPKTPKTRTRHNLYIPLTSASVTRMLDQPTDREGVALAHKTYMERLTENLYTMQKSMERKTMSS